MPRKNFIVFLLACLVLSACSASAASATPQPDVQNTSAAADTLPTLPAGALFQVIKPDGSSVAFTLDDLKQLPLSSLSADGKFEEGPSLKDVLTAAGVAEYSSIHIDGSSSPAELTREQVEAGSILDFNNHGTVKLASPAIEKAKWTKDVSLIEVKK